MKDFAIKGTITVIFAAAAAYFHKLMGPVIVLAIVMAGDYVTGVAAAWVAGTLSSRAGLLGFIKKLGYLVAVGVAVVVDYVIVGAAAGTGMDLGNNHIFGLLVTIWFILNECISILENLSEIGVRVGETVQAGQTIGKTGTTGLAGGDHLHFGVLVWGHPVEPLEWLDPKWVKNNMTDRISAPL